MFFVPFTISEWEYLRGFEEESKYNYVEREYFLAPMNYASVDPLGRPITTKGQ